MKNVKFDTRRRVWDGVVNYGSEFQDLEKDSLADHVLVLVIRPYKLSWIQPIASFATSGAAPPPVLHRIIIKAITTLHTMGTETVKNKCKRHQKC